MVPGRAEGGGVLTGLFAAAGACWVASSGSSARSPKAPSVSTVSSVAAAATLHLCNRQAEASTGATPARTGSFYYPPGVAFGGRSGSFLVTHPLQLPFLLAGLWCELRRNPQVAASHSGVASLQRNQSKQPRCRKQQNPMIKRMRSLWRPWTWRVSFTTRYCNKIYLRYM